MLRKSSLSSPGLSIQVVLNNTNCSQQCFPLGQVSSLSQFWSTHGPPMKVCLKGLGCTNPSIVLLPSFWSPQQEQSHKASKMMCRCLVARVDPVRASCVSSSNSPTCNNLLRPRNPPLLPRPKQASVGWTGFWTVTK